MQMFWLLNDIITALIEATVIFWIVHFVVQVIALRTLLRQPSIALAGLLALASTVLALVIVALIVTDLKISGADTYVLAALIVWATTAAADTAGHRAIREERRER